MDTLIHADIFFFVSTICFVVLTGLLVVMFTYVIGILRRIRAVSDKIGDNVEHISEDARDFIKDVRESGVYRMLFGKKTRKSK